MKLCYCDESGTGGEPIATIAGVVVDATRMHVTKKDWADLLKRLSTLTGKSLAEVHTNNLYKGSGIWHSIDGPTRSNVVSAVFSWLKERKHSVVYAAVDTRAYVAGFDAKDIPDGVNTPWRFMGFHLVLAMQKYCQRIKKNKGHTIFVFDNRERDKMRFTDLVRQPPPWSDGYYGKKVKQEALDQIVDVPYFGDSQDVYLIQMADFIAFFLRRYAELEEGHSTEVYPGEQQKVRGWAATIAGQSIGRAMMYPKTGRDYAEDLFYRYAPASIREL